MEAVLTRAPLPATVEMRPSLRAWLAALVRHLAERVPLSSDELSPEWFRFPLP